MESSSLETVMSSSTRTMMEELTDTSSTTGSATTVDKMKLEQQHSGAILIYKPRCASVHMCVPLLSEMYYTQSYLGLKARIAWAEKLV